MISNYLLLEKLARRENITTPTHTILEQIAAISPGLVDNIGKQNALKIIIEHLKTIWMSRMVGSNETIPGAKTFPVDKLAFDWIYTYNKNLSYYEMVNLYYLMIEAAVTVTYTDFTWKTDTKEMVAVTTDTTKTTETMAVIAEEEEGQQEPASVEG